VNQDKSLISLSQLYNDFRTSKVLIIGLFFLVLGSLMFEYKAIRFLCFGLSLSLQIPFIFKINPRIFYSTYGLYGLYLLVCLISVSWSVDWTKTLGKIGEVIVGFLWVSYAISNGILHLNKVYRFSIFMIFCMLLISLSLYCIGVESFVDPNIYSVIGVKAISNPVIGTNGVGLLGAILILVFLAEYQCRPSRYVFWGMVFGLLMMFLAYSRTSFVALILGAVIILSQSIRRSLLIAMTLGFFGLLFGIEFVIDFFHRGQSFQNILSGRPELWALAFEEYLNSPWLGYGYGVGSAYAVRDIFFHGGQAAGTAHNGLLEALLGIGIFGTTLLTIVFVYSSAKFFKLIRDRRYAFFFASYPVMFCSSIMNTGISGWFGLPMLIYLVMLARLALLPSQARRFN